MNIFLVSILLIFSTQSNAEQTIQTPKEILKTYENYCEACQSYVTIETQENQLFVVFKGEPALKIMGFSEANPFYDLSQTNSDDKAVQIGDYLCIQKKIHSQLLVGRMETNGFINCRGAGAICFIHG